MKPSSIPMNHILMNDGAGSYRPLPGVQITEVNDNWVTGIVDGHWFQAKVFASPSQFGINEGRVSKLTISKSDIWNGFSRSKVMFNYDRGLDFGRMNGVVLNKILEVFA